MAPFFKRALLSYPFSVQVGSGKMTGLANFKENSYIKKFFIT
jgi:hypothetical protein